MTRIVDADLYAERRKRSSIKKDLERALASQDPEVRRLANQIARQQTRLASMGGSTGKGGPSVVSRIFDVLQRGQYATANVAKSLVDDDNSGNVLSAFARGLTGKDKTSYSQVLDEAGMAGGWQRSALGFIGDVALDPTTYIGGGVVKGASKALKGADAARSFEKVYQTAMKLERAEGVARAAKTSASVDAIKTGKKLTKKKLEKIGEQAKHEWAEEIARTSKNLAEEGFEKATPTAGKLEFRVLGKPVASSERAYGAIADATAPLRNSETAQNLSKMFRTTATFKHGTNLLKRRAENRGVAQFEDFIRADNWEHVAHKLTRAEADEVSHAIEAGLDLGATPLKRDESITLGQVQAIAKKKMDELFDREVELGLVKLDQKLDNYVHHFYRNTKGEVQKFKNKRKALGPSVLGAAKERTIPTLKDAQAAGLKPVTDIRQILTNRGAKSFQVESRKKFVDDVVSQFGVPVTDKTGIERLKKLDPDLEEFVDKDLLPDQKFMLPSEVKKTLGSVEKVFNDPEAWGQFSRLAEKIQQQWKFFATVPNPGHHFRNIMGDAFNNYLDGVVDPKAYTNAIRILRKQGKYKIGKGELDGFELYRLYSETGAKQGFYHSELGQRGLQGRMREMSEHRENWGRMAHFYDAMKKEMKGKDPNNIKLRNEAAQRASERVKKWNIDYGDLTDFEKAKMRRIVPFYTWMRKNIPLQLEAMALRPGRVAVVPKGLRAMQQILGEEGDTNPEFVFPKWLQEMNATPWNTDSASPLAWAPALPFFDVGRFAEGGKEGILREALSSTSPFLRIPVEQAMGQQIFTGAPIKDNQQYAADQLPGARILPKILQAATGNADFSDPNDDTLQKIINYMTGAGVYKVTPKRQLGELRRRQDPLQAEIRKLRQAQRGS